MNKFSILLVASTALTACTTMTAEPELAAMQIDNDVVEQLSDDPAAKPELGNYGFDLAGMDAAVKPVSSSMAWSILSAV